MNVNKDKEFEEIIARVQKIVKPLTEEQRAFVRKMEKRLPYLEKRLKEQRELPELETVADEKI